VASIPAVKALEGRYRARGLRVVSVTREDDRLSVETATKEHGMTYPGFLDIEGAWSRTAGLRAIPAFLVIDKAGRLAYLHRGKLTADSDGFERMTAIIEQALTKG
jgi:hypothetical protein